MLKYTENPESISYISFTDKDLHSFVKSHKMGVNNGFYQSSPISSDDFYSMFRKNDVSCFWPKMNKTKVRSKSI